MKRGILLAALLIAASATSVIAAGPYVEGSTGISIYHEGDIGIGGDSVTASYDPGFALDVGGGYSFDCGVRLGGEIGFREAEMTRRGGLHLDDTDLGVTSMMATGVYEIKTGGPIAPFFGAGIGALYANLDFHGHHYDDTVFGYQLSTGLAIALPHRLSLDLTYKFQGAASDFNIDDTDVSYHSSNILAGVRYTFR